MLTGAPYTPGRGGIAPRRSGQLLTPVGRRIVVGTAAASDWARTMRRASAIGATWRRSRVGVDDESMGGRGLGTAEVDLGGEVCYGVLYGEEPDDQAQAADARS